MKGDAIRVTEIDRFGSDAIATASFWDKHHMIHIWPALLSVHSNPGKAL
jgi:hypothetical protein